MSPDVLPIQSYCIGCKSLEAGLKNYINYGFKTKREMAVCAFRLCKNPAPEISELPIENAAEVDSASLCDFGGSVLLKADATAGAQKYLGMSQIEAEEFLGYTNPEG